MDISRAKAQLSALVELARAGEEVIIGKAGKPVANLVPFKGITQPRVPGKLRGQIVIADDFEMMPAELLEEFGIDTK